MANVRQDRVPDPTLGRASTPAPEGPAVNGRGTAPRGVVLALRLRTPDIRGSGADVSWTGNSPAATLAIDVITASGGAPDPPQGAVLAARFFNLPSALLAARRIRWALEGLGENVGSQGAATVAVHSADDPVAAGVAALLENVAPGQVLVSIRVAEALQQLPGASLRPSADGHWREVEWRGVETPSGFSADEQSVLGLIRALGREDPCATQAVEMRPAAPAPNPPATEVAEGLGRSRLEPEPVSGFAKRKWLIVGGAAAAVVLVAALVIPALVSGSHGKTPAPNPDTPARPAEPAAAAPAPLTPPPSTPVVDKPQPPKQPSKSGKQPKTEAKVDQQPAQKLPAGSCDLTEAEIPRSLSRAEKYMYDGKLEEAQAMYQRVLPCPSWHEKAVEGLQHVHQRMAAQSP